MVTFHKGVVMFKLRELPFPANANAVVSAKTCEFHHGKHHANYVATLNKLLEQSGEFGGAHLLEILQKADGALFNNAAQVYNHDFYWDCIARSSAPEGELMAAINAHHGDFKAEFIAAASAHFGSGWCWLVYDPAGDALKILCTANADTPSRHGLVPLFVADVWEHAYYLDYQNARAAYLEKLFANANWQFVSEAYEWAKKEGMGSVRYYIDKIHPEAR